MSYKQPLEITAFPPLPALNQYTYVIDSTRRTITPIVVSAARAVPGTFRHAYSGGRVRCTVKNGDQDVTCSLLLLTGPTLTTNAAWEVDATATSAGTFTITANSTKVIDWLPRTSDFAVELLAGGTATSALTTTCRVDFAPQPAV